AIPAFLCGRPPVWTFSISASEWNCRQDGSDAGSTVTGVWSSTDWRRVSSRQSAPQVMQRPLQMALTGAIKTLKYRPRLTGPLGHIDNHRRSPAVQDSDFVSASGLP